MSHPESPDEPVSVPAESSAPTGKSAAIPAPAIPVHDMDVAPEVTPEPTAYVAPAPAAAPPAVYPPAADPPASYDPATTPASSLPSSGYGAYAPAGYPVVPQPGTYPAAPYPAAPYPAAPYPTAAYPTAGYPGAVAAPAKKRSVAAIVFAVLMVVFLVAAAGATVLYVQKDSAMSKATSSDTKTIAAQKSQIAQLASTLQTKSDQAASAQQTSEGQINQLQHSVTLDMACVNATITMMAAKTGSAFEKDWNVMYKACQVAKAES